MSIWSKNPPKPDDEYDPSRLYDVHEHGITLNLEQFRKKPGIQEDLAALEDIAQAIREKQQRSARENRGNDK